MCILKIINWLCVVFVAPIVWIEINKTSFYSIAWITLFLPLVVGIFFLKSQSGKSKVLHWIFIFLFGLEAPFLLANGYIFSSLPVLFIFVQLLWMNLNGSDCSIKSSNSQWANGLMSIVLAFFILWGALNYLGFCFKRFYYISDKEKIRIAVADFIKIKRENSKNHDKYSYSYMDVDNFLKANEGCCKVSGGAFFGSIKNEWMYRLSGRLSDYVYITETNRYKDQRMMPDNAVYIIALTNCGEIWQPLH